MIEQYAKEIITAIEDFLRGNPDADRIMMSGNVSVIHDMEEDLFHPREIRWSDKDYQTFISADQQSVTLISMNGNEQILLSYNGFGELLDKYQEEKGRWHAIHVITQGLEDVHRFPFLTRHKTEGDLMDAIRDCVREYLENCPDTSRWDEDPFTLLDLEDQVPDWMMKKHGFLMDGPSTYAEIHQIDEDLSI